MKKIKKLHSSSGASLLIALVFLLFCTFVGGSVLAAATANAGRVDSLKNDQQEYLNERSAALLLKGQLQSKNNPHIIFTKSVVNKVQVVYTNGGVYDEVGNTTKTTTLTITVNAEVNSPVERIMYETAILRYLQLHFNENEEYSSISIEGFTYGNDTIDSLSDLWLYSSGSVYKPETSMTVELKKGSTEMNSIDASLYCADGNEKPAGICSMYSFYVGFGSDAKLNLQMLAGVNERTTGPIVTRVKERVNNVDLYYKLSTTDYVTEISWNAPEIGKGAFTSA